MTYKIVSFNCAEANSSILSKKYATRRVNYSLAYKVLELLALRNGIIINNGYISGISKLINHAESKI